MISFPVGEARFNYRVGGVCVHNDHILLVCYDGDESMWTLPGGRVEALEASQTALRRELREELGIAVAIERLLWIVENFFPWSDGRRCHELGLYYMVALPEEGCPLRDTARGFEGRDGATLLTFRWMPLAALDDFPLKPAFLRARLRHLPAHTEHVVQIDREPDHSDSPRST